MAPGNKQVILPYLALALFVSSVLAQPSFSQPRAVSIEKLPLDAREQWQSPRFSPDGKSVYFTSSAFKGIWQYSMKDRSVRQITGDARAGFGFSLSRDGSQVAYRRHTINAKTGRAQYQIILKKLDSGTSSLLATGPDLSLPSFIADKVVYSVGRTTRNLQPAQAIHETAILATDDAKISLWKSGKKILLDPLGNGRYIWPSLSPDGKLIVAYDMERGAFVCDINGEVSARLGKVDSPAWTRSGNWIIFMEDKDDGHHILSSDIWFVSPDGKKKGKITDTPDLIELNPQCSPVENKITYHSAEGEIFLLTYTE